MLYGCVCVCVCNCVCAKMTTTLEDVLANEVQEENSPNLAKEDTLKVGQEA